MTPDASGWGELLGLAVGGPGMVQRFPVRHIGIYRATPSHPPNFNGIFPFKNHPATLGYLGVLSMNWPSLGFFGSAPVILSPARRLCRRVGPRRARGKRNRHAKIAPRSRRCPWARGENVGFFFAWPVVSQFWAILPCQGVSKDGHNSKGFRKWSGKKWETILHIIEDRMEKHSLEDRMETESVLWFVAVPVDVVQAPIVETFTISQQNIAELQTNSGINDPNLSKSIQIYPNLSQKKSMSIPKGRKLFSNFAWSQAASAGARPDRIFDNIMDPAAPSQGGHGWWWQEIPIGVTGTDGTTLGVWFSWFGWFWLRARSQIFFLKQRRIGHARGRRTRSRPFCSPSSFPSTIDIHTETLF